MTDQQQPPVAPKPDGIPERLFAKACHPERPNKNCSWSVSKEPIEDSVEYARVQPVAPRVYHCSCGAACTADEYIAHLLQGHDRGLPVVSGSDLCVCSHVKSQHEAFSDHDECLGCRGLDEPCSEFRRVFSSERKVNDG